MFLVKYCIYEYNSIFLDPRFHEERKPYERPFSMDINSRKQFPTLRDRDINSPPRFPTHRNSDVNSPTHFSRDRDVNSPPRFPRGRDVNSPPRFSIKEEPEPMVESGAGVDPGDIGENQVQIKTELPTGGIGKIVAFSHR